MLLITVDILRKMEAAKYYRFFESAEKKLKTSTKSFILLSSPNFILYVYIALFEIANNDDHEHPRTQIPIFV